MSNFILAVHYGLVHDHIEYVEMTQGTPMHVTLTKDPTKATHRSLEEAKKWAKDILRNGEGVGTWKIEVMPLEDASIKIDPELQATIGDLPEMTTNQSKLEENINKIMLNEMPDGWNGSSKSYVYVNAKKAIVTYITANYTPINQPSTKITPVTDGVGGSESTNQSEHKEVK